MVTGSRGMFDARQLLRTLEECAVEGRLPRRILRNAARANVHPQYRIDVVPEPRCSRR